MKAPPILRDSVALVGFTAAMIVLPACGLYLAAWVLWSALYADWMTVLGWLAWLKS